MPKPRHLCLSAELLTFDGTVLSEPLESGTQVEVAMQLPSHRRPAHAKL